MASSSSNTVHPVHRDWEQILDQHIDIIHYAINQEDSMMLKAAFASAQLSSIDWAATFHDEAKSMGQNVYEHSSNIMRELEDRALDTNKRIREDTNNIKQSMEQLANSGENVDPDDWERNLDHNIDMLHKRARDQLEDMRQYGRKKIRELPQRLRHPAARAFSGALIAVFSFDENAVTFLRVASDDIQSWYQQPYNKIREFDDSANRWYEGSRHTIKGWFGGIHHRGMTPLSDASRHHHRRHNGEDNLPAIKDIATKLQCMGLESFTIVRKGNGWALEIDSPN